MSGIVSLKEMLQISESMAEKLISSASLVNAGMLGLDRRAGAEVWTHEDFIAVRRYNDRALAHYGGFEYIDSDLRPELGDFVFYSSISSRVQRALDHLEPTSCEENN